MDRGCLRAQIFVTQFCDDDHLLELHKCARAECSRYFLGGQVPAKRIGILGGSFNPPHLGHVGMARLVLKEKKVDQVWVVPCFKHPFGKPLVFFPHRFRMCRIAFKRFGKRLRLLDLERKLGGKSYTLRTVTSLQKKYPAKEFWLIVGKDVAREAKRWHGYRELKKQVRWLVLPRGKKSPIANIRATKIREALRNGGSLKGLLPKNVIEYVSHHRLYKRVR